MPQLTTPSKKYQESYLVAVSEYQAEGLAHYQQFDLPELSKHFDEYIQRLLEQVEGKNLPAEWVPHTELWLVEGDEFLGRVDIRHKLNEALKKHGGHIGYDVRPTQRRKGFGKLALKLGIETAKEMGVENIVVTCDVTNRPSNKIIQNNGGQLVDTFPMGQGLPDKNKYTIS